MKPYSKLLTSKSTALNWCLKVWLIFFFTTLTFRKVKIPCFLKTNYTLSLSREKEAAEGELCFNGCVYVLTYCRFGEATHRHGEAQERVVLVLRQTQQLHDVRKGLWCGVPVEGFSRLSRVHVKKHQRSGIKTNEALGMGLLLNFS